MSPLVRRSLVTFLVAANAAWCLVFIRTFLHDLKNDRKLQARWAELHATSSADGVVCAGDSPPGCSSRSSSSP